MDGVLIDAREWHYEALNQALELFGYNISRYDHLVTYDGLPTRTKLDMLTRERGFPLDLHDFVCTLKQKYTMRTVQLKCSPVFSHEYALSRLKQDGYLLGVASNSIRDTVDTMMNLSNLSRYLTITLNNGDVSLPKPSPDIYILAMSKLGLDPTECLVIEDNEHGMAAARASGAWLMEVDSPLDVTYDNINSFITRVEGMDP